MALCIVLLFAPETYSQGVKGKVRMFTISGKVGEPGVTMQGLPGSPAPVTDENGVYSVEVRYGWSGTVTPVKSGFTFDPKQRAYSNVVEEKTTDDYVATLQTFTIAGTTGKPGVTLRGLPGDPNSDPNGRYSVQVSFGFTGTVVPELKGFKFEPASREYTQLTEDKKNDNYTASVQTFTISGSAGAEGVVMKGLPGDPKTNKDGTYRAEVSFEWNGKVTPLKEGYEFTPDVKEYSDVTDNVTNDDYVAHVFTFEISGSTGMAGVVLAGLPGDPITDLDGRYTATVEYGWLGKITPTKPGYSFKPTMIDIPKVTDNKPSQDFTGSIMQYTISGTTGTGGVKLTGLPVEVTCGTTGTYSVKVDFGWTGTVTPEKEGYTFEPATLFLGPIEKDLAKQDFKSKPLTFTIAGNVQLPGVLMQNLPGRIVSGPDGAYSVEVPYKWTSKGSVTPVKEGHIFDPAKRDYTGVTESMAAENYTPMIKQYTVAGRVTSEKGPLADVYIMTDKPGISTVTGPDGEFTLNIEHGGTCKLMPQKDGCAFTPLSKAVGPVTANLTNQSFAGKMRMVTITDTITMENEPVQGVTIADKTGAYTAVTDAKGRYSVQVPFGWTGELFWTKPGFDFDPPSELHQNVTENIDRTGTAPKPPATGTGTQPTGGTTQPAGAGTQPTGAGRQPTGAGRQPTGAGTQPTGAGTLPAVDTGAGTKTAAPIGPALTEKEILEQKIRELTGQLNQVPGKTDANSLTNLPKGTPIPTVGPVDVQSNVGPIVNGTFAGSVIDVLTQICQKTGAKVYADATVKADMIQPVTITGMAMASALPTCLKGTKYTFRRIEKPEEAWQVFLPISNSFGGDDLRQALQDIGIAAGVPVIPDETVSGQVYADLPGVPLEVALETILAGTSYVVKKTQYYYLVADRKVDSGAFPQISETRQVRLNYITPNSARSLLSQAFVQYVQAELDPNSHLITVTAPPTLADRIVKDIKSMDLRPQHVLLDARIVSMERGDLLNIGVEWGMPTAQFGFHDSSYLRGTLPAGEINPAGNWPWGLSVGFSFDRTFTNSLNAALNLLKENSKVDILSSPQVVGRDGRRSRIQVITEEHFAMTPATTQQGYFYTQTEFTTVTSGTTLEITPLIGDNNDITLDLAVEVSDSIPRGRGSDLPVVTRRTSQNSVTIKDGGTVAVAGLTENRTRQKETRVPFFGDLPLVGGLFRNSDADKGTREIAVFVTARLVPDVSTLTGQLPTAAGGSGRIMSPVGDSFRQELKDSLSR
jgi:type II secretory pathway component GspD/PulD (secretin)